jgi:hypothetical protein
LKYRNGLAGLRARGMPRFSPVREWRQSVRLL